MFEKNMTVICEAEDWYSTFGTTMRIPLGTKLTIKRSYRFNSIEMLEFNEFPENGFVASGFKRWIN